MYSKDTTINKCTADDSFEPFEDILYIYPLPTWWDSLLLDLLASKVLSCIGTWPYYLPSISWRLLVAIRFPQLSLKHQIRNNRAWLYYLPYDGLKGKQAFPRGWLPSLCRAEMSRGHVKDCVRTPHMNGPVSFAFSYPPGADCGHLAFL